MNGNIITVLVNDVFVYVTYLTKVRMHIGAFSAKIMCHDTFNNSSPSEDLMILQRCRGGARAQLCCAILYRIINKSKICSHFTV